MSDDLLFREVDEEVRRDELEGIWKKYGTLIITGCLAIILSVGGYKGWQYWQKTQAEAGGQAFFAASDLAKAGKTKEAQEAFSKLKTSHAGYAVFGQFKQAAAKVTAGDKKAAVAAYDALAVAKNVAAPLQQLAKIKAAYLLADTSSVDDIKTRVGQFEAKDNPWRNSAREIIAISAFAANDVLLADRKVNEILADVGATQGARQRARIFLSVLTPILAQKGLSNKALPNTTPSNTKKSN